MWVLPSYCGPLLWCLSFFVATSTRDLQIVRLEVYRTGWRWIKNVVWKHSNGGIFDFVNEMFIEPFMNGDGVIDAGQTSFDGFYSALFCICEYKSSYGISQKHCWGCSPIKAEHAACLDTFQWPWTCWARALLNCPQLMMVCIRRMKGLLNFFQQVNSDKNDKSKCLDYANRRFHRKSGKSRSFLLHMPP